MRETLISYLLILVSISLVTFVLAWFFKPFGPRKMIFHGICLFCEAALLVGLVRAPTRILTVYERVGPILTNPVVAILVVLLLLEVAMLGIALQSRFLPLPIPTNIMILGHFVVCIVFMIHLSSARLSQWLNRTRKFWIGVSIIQVAMLVLAGLVYLNSQPQVESFFRLRLEGKRKAPKGHYKPVSDPNLDADAFWEDYYKYLFRVDASRWMPYVYWRSGAYEGPFHNVSSKGLRKTAFFASNIDENTPRVFVFGGSTVWGIGVRDEYTVPSCLARSLHHDFGLDVVVSNFGEGAYVGVQDMILFTRQLQLDNKPDVAVFFQGLNEVYAVTTTGVAGAPMYEAKRVRSWNLEHTRQYRRERYAKTHSFLLPQSFIKSFPILAWPLSPLDYPPTLKKVAPGLDVSLVATGETAADVVKNYLGNVRVTEAICKEYGVLPLFVWQPVPFHGKPLTEYEAMRVERREKIVPGTIRLFVDTYAELKREMKRRPIRRFLDLSGLFQGESGLIYIDEGHVTDEGNAMIGKAIAAEVERMIRKRPRSSR